MLPSSMSGGVSARFARAAPWPPRARRARLPVSGLSPPAPRRSPRLLEALAALGRADLKPSWGRPSPSGAFCFLDGLPAPLHTEVDRVRYISPPGEPLSGHGYRAIDSPGRT